MKAKSRGEFVYRVLTTLANASIALAKNPGRTTGSLYRAMREFEELQEATNEQLRNISKYIVGRKYIIVRKKPGGRAEIELTENGKKAVQTAAIRALRPPVQSVWDRKWRIVIFDVPNFAKRSRDAFAATLKRLGFLPVQKSVFICPYPCEEELEVVADFFGVRDYVDVIVAERITRADVWKRTFGL
jgi:DNA-binding transcriptional regulator PaaX